MAWGCMLDTVAMLLRPVLWVRLYKVLECAIAWGLVVVLCQLLVSLIPFVVVDFHRAILLQYLVPSACLFLVNFS